MNRLGVLDPKSLLLQIVAHEFHDVLIVFDHKNTFHRFSLCRCFVRFDHTIREMNPPAQVVDVSGCGIYSDFARSITGLILVFLIQFGQSLQTVLF